MDVLIAAVRAAAAGLGGMADGALFERAVRSLQSLEFDPIARVGAGGDGVRAIVTGRAIQAAVSRG